MTRAVRSQLTSQRLHAHGHGPASPRGFNQTLPGRVVATPPLAAQSAAAAAATRQVKSCKWQASSSNFDGLPQSTGGCEHRFFALEQAADACYRLRECGSIVKDAGARCGANQMKFHYHLRSSNAIRAPFPLNSWVLVNRSRESSCSSKPRGPRSSIHTPREKWLLFPRQRAGPRSRAGAIAPLTVLISGTLRGYRKCAPSLYTTVLVPNHVQRLAVSTYDQTDCGTSSFGHFGLGKARNVSSSFASVYSFAGTSVTAHIEPTSRIEDLKHMHSKATPPVFIRYHSQFLLRSLAWRDGTLATPREESANRIYVLTRPDAHLFGEWSFTRAIGETALTYAALKLRDGTTCHASLTPNVLIAPWSEIHANLWDDTLAIGYGAAMQHYVGFHSLMPQRAWIRSEKVSRHDHRGHACPP
jgi:hypothetical protein